MTLSIMAGLPARNRLANYRLVILLSVFLLKSAKADILVYKNLQLLEEFRDFPATFGGDIPESGLKVRAVQALPPDGCSAMDGPPDNVTSMTPIGGSTRYAAVIARYNCSFEEKVRNAQKAGFAAVIVHNVGSNDLERMSANHAEDIVIPSVFIGEYNGVLIIESYLYPQNYALIITDDVPFNINNNLIIPFAIVVGLSFIIMVCFLIIRCVRERRRMLRHRLPNKILKKIPIVKFAKGMQYDTCAICLDDYIENERLRVLPCHHAYHVKCIDPWLTKNRRVCPICKRTVFARGERRPRYPRSSTDSLSSSDADENTPLLNRAENTPNSTAPSIASPSQDNGTAASQTSQPANDVHVVNVTSDDDELLDDNNVQAVSNLNIRRMLTPSHIRNVLRRERMLSEISAHPDSNSAIDGEGESSIGSVTEVTPPPGVWNKFLRQLRWLGGRQQEQQLLSDDDVEPATGRNSSVAGGSSIATTAASNNILNSNLSGSFHGDDTTDDEIVGANRRNTTRRSQVRSAPNLNPTSGGAGGSGSSDIVRLGVAALPNVNFNPNQPTRGSNRRASRSGNNGSGNNYPV